MSGKEKYEQAIERMGVIGAPAWEDLPERDREKWEEAAEADGDG